MKKFALIVAALIGISQLMAQGSLGKSDPEAKKVLDKVSAKFKSYKAVQASFVLSVEDSKGKIQGSKKGTVFMKGSKYRVSITGQEIFCDGKNVWTLDKAANEVTITQLDESGSGITPQKLFTDFYDKDFLYKLNGQKQVAGKTIQEIELTPVDKTRNFFKVYVQVDKKTQSIYSTRVLDKSGNVYVYTISSLKGNAPLNDSVFVFDKSKYPGVEEIDLR
ncbi:MAG TPA: outer membrane lipoprotein carrier protein LolA [Chitinophagaceae bacterium]|nr:outer membrane lipoprotein carrier protein LolA [Chitinophagaceae bacterium]